MKNNKSIYIRKLDFDFTDESGFDWYKPDIDESCGCYDRFREDWNFCPVCGRKIEWEWRLI